MDDVGFEFGLTLAIVACVICVICAHGCGTSSAHREAVKAGVAEYRVDTEGSVTFHWKPSTQPVESEGR